MRKGIIYLLMGISLLFTAKRSIRIDFHSFENQQKVSYSLLSAEKHHPENSFHKASSPHFDFDSAGFSEETDADDFSLPSCFGTVFFANTTGLSYWFNKYLKYKKKSFYVQKPVSSAVRKFILLQNIRI